MKDVPGGLFVALIWQLLQYSGSAYVSAIVKDSSATAGVFALVLGMMAWIYLGALAVRSGSRSMSCTRGGSTLGRC